jgi:hypothetical protein
LIGTEMIVKTCSTSWRGGKRLLKIAKTFKPFLQRLLFFLT